MTDDIQIGDNELQLVAQTRALDVLDIDAQFINEEERTVEIRFSSEYPVDRSFGDYKGKEILDHAPKSVRLGRLQSKRAPVLVNHDSNDQVGVIDSASIDRDRVGRAVIRFGRSDRANEIFQDLVDGIRRSFSVGYRIYKIVEKVGKQFTELRVTDWEPTEISVVPSGADPSAAVGRSHETLNLLRIETMSDETIEPGQSQDPEITFDAEAFKREQINYAKNIRAIGKQYDCKDQAERAIENSTSVADFTNEVLEVVAKRAEQVKPSTYLGLDGKEEQSYSLFRAINAYLANDWSKAGLEAECHEAILDKLGRDANGFYVPYEIQKRNAPAANPSEMARLLMDMGRFEEAQRVMLTTTGSAGGFLVGTDHLAGSFIELLRQESLMGQLGARTLPGLVGDVDIPRLDTGSTFEWLTEDEDQTPADAVLGQLTLSPKTVAAAVPISRRMLKQSSPSVEQMLMSDMGLGAALAIDTAGFQGAGTGGVPEGITNTTGVGTVTITTAGQPTHANVVAFETDVAAANALRGRLSYVGTAGLMGHLKTTALDAGSGIMLMRDGQVNGYPFRVNNTLAANSLIFGDFSQAVIGLWGVLDVEPDKATKAASGGLVLRCFQDIDIGIRHAGAFSINA